jgi:hypothetical protein
MEREYTIEQIVADAVGFGPLEMLFADDRVAEIRVEGPDRIMVRRGESFEKADVAFRSLEHLYLIAGRLLGTEGTWSEPAPNSVVERDVPADFQMTARFPATALEAPSLHFRRLRPAVEPVPIPAPRLPRREQQLFVAFVKACWGVGVDDLQAADEARLRPVAEQVVDEFLAEEGVPDAEERKRLVVLILNEARVNVG